MWKRTELKKKARASMKQNYWKIISVCFIIALLTTAYPVSTTFISLQIAPDAQQYSDAVFALDIPNSEVIMQTVSHFLENAALPGLTGRIVSSVIQLVIDMYSTHLSIFFAVLRTVNTFLYESPGTGVLFTAAGLLLAFLYQIFISNILLIGEKRFFLESHSYKQTNISKIFFLYKLRCLLRPAWIMFCRSFYQFLWNLTIVGGIIKHYEYSMIPFILAENPRIRRKDAFFLSRQLTAHNKWKLFLLDASFAGWEILSILTLGLLDFVLVNPYLTICRSELYLSLRRNYVLSRSPRYERLNDSYLEHVPSEDELLISKALYDDSNGPYTKISYFAPEQYPVFLFSVQPPVRAVRTPVKADRKYDACSLIFLFHAFSLSGWLLETAIHLIQNGTLDPNAAVFAPWMPLYGIYGILTLLLTRRVLRKPVFAFFISFALYSVLEYLINLSSELLSGIPLRDYSEFFLNLNGRIYLGGSAAFALLGCAFAYYLAPRWTEVFIKPGRAVRWSVCVALCLLFAADIVLTLL